MERVLLTDMAQAMNATALNAAAREMDETEVVGVSTDSRSTRGGELFFAIRGDSFDGHDFVAQALHAGASAAVVARGREKDIATDVGAPLLSVDDTLSALHAAAGWYRGLMDATVVGVTGTNGKTTTKDMTAAVLSTRMRTARTTGNYNNHIGVPLTLFDIERRHEAVVVEMGMNHLGEITLLAGMARPSIGVVTNIGAAHLEHMKDLETVATAKGELLEALPADGTSVLNWDDERVRALESRGPKQVVTFGLDEGADVRGEDVTEGEKGVSFTLSGGQRVELPAHGRHNVMNALAAVAVGRVMGVDEAAAASGLRRFDASPMRMSVAKVGVITLLNDAYNCNPSSLLAALRTLVDIARGRETAVALGDMLELGAASSLAHRSAGEAAAGMGVDRLYLFGTEVEATRRGAVEAGMRESAVRVFENKTALAGAIWDELGEDAVLLVKGSRGMRMEEVVELLMREAPASRIGRSGSQLP